MDSMKEALLKRRSKSLDISLMVNGEPVFESEIQAEKSSDLAPKGESKMVPQMQGEPNGEESMAAEMSEQDGGEEMDDLRQAVTGQMSDYEKKDIMSRKPRSLGERAKLEAMKK